VKKMIERIFSEPNNFLGQIVKLQGRFVGWPTDKCKFPSQATDKPLTRSDWVIQVDDFCIYVTGGKPEGLDFLNSSDVGRLVEIEAEVLKTNSDKIYFRYRKGRVI
jgi:hypothetical protein